MDLTASARLVVLSNPIPGKASRTTAPPPAEAPKAAPTRRVCIGVFRFCVR